MINKRYLQVLLIFILLMMILTMTIMIMMMMMKFRVHRCATSKALINLFILCSLESTTLHFSLHLSLHLSIHLCPPRSTMCLLFLCYVAASILNINCCVQCEPIAGAPLCHNSHQFPHVSWINLNYPRAIHHPSFHIGRTTGHLFF